MHITVKRTDNINRIGMLREDMRAIADDIVRADRRSPDQERDKKFAITLKYEWRGHRLTIGVKRKNATNYVVFFLTAEDMEAMGLQCLREGDELVMKKYWWLAVNGSSVALCPFPAEPDEIRASPIPEQLLGFPTAEEAAEWQQFLLTAPIEEVTTRISRGLSEDTHEIIRPGNPEPPSTETMWSAEKTPTVEVDDPIKQVKRESERATARDGQHRVRVFTLQKKIEPR